MGSVVGLVRPKPVVCWPWHLHFLADQAGHPIGGSYTACQQDVAVPRDQSPAGAICLYCAMDQGLVEAVDRPFSSEEGDG
jgi:hypothetical protein